MMNIFSFIIPLSEIISVDEIKAKQLELKKFKEISKENIYKPFAEVKKMKK